MEALRDAKILAQHLAARADNGATIFGIDGIDGAGKTKTGKELSTLLGWTIVHLDKYLISDRETYVENLEIERLIDDIFFAKRPVLVEGMCLLELANRLHLAIDVLVYVRRVSRTGRWEDEEECLFDCSPEDRIRELEDELSQLYGPNAVEGGALLTELRKEVIAYHAKYRPSEAAEFVFDLEHWSEEIDSVVPTA